MNIWLKADKQMPYVSIHLTPTRAPKGWAGAGVGIGMVLVGISLIEIKIKNQM